jgi:hypothetical protein
MLTIRKKISKVAGFRLATLYSAMVINAAKKIIDSSQTENKKEYAKNRRKYPYLRLSKYLGIKK